MTPENPFADQLRQASNNARMDVLIPRQIPGGKTYWVKIGSAQSGKEPGEINIFLDALPLPNANGTCLMVVKHQRADANTSASRVIGGTRITGRPPIAPMPPQPVVRPQNREPDFIDMGDTRPTPPIEAYNDASGPGISDDVPF